MFFVHVIDNFTEEGLCKYISDSFPQYPDNYHIYQNPLENKSSAKECTLDKIAVKMGLNILQNEKFLNLIEEKSGIKVENDPHLHGAGLHLYQNGSFLTRHLDYSIHPITGKERRMNAILYVSEWDSIYGGALCFYDATGNVLQKIYPKFNRLVLFETNDFSYYGVELCQCPPEIQRKILTVFYVSDPRPDIVERKRAQFFPDDEYLNDVAKIRSERLLLTADFEKENLLILFAAHNTNQQFNQGQLNYVKELLTLPPEKTIYVLTTGKNMLRPSEWPKNVIIIEDKNFNVDFGLWWRALLNEKFNLLGKLKRGHYKKLLLVNDSCTSISPLINVYLKMFKFEFWGICDSMQNSYHLQSYFLFFSGSNSINSFLQFFELNQFSDSKEMAKTDIIMKYEIGLSSFMISKKFVLNSAYSHTFFDINVKENQSFSFWKELLLRGCPLLKNTKKSDYQENLKKFSFLATIKDFVQNKNGLEIGGPSDINGPIIYTNCNKIDNVIFKTEDGIQDFYAKAKQRGKVYIAEANNLSNINDGTYDFLFASNLLPHLANPLKALKEFKRVLKDIGYIVIVLQDNTNNRVETKFSTVLKKFTENVGEDDLSSLPEVLKNNINTTSLESFVKKCLDNENNRCLNHHVFSDTLIYEMCSYVGIVVYSSFVDNKNNWYILKKC